MADIDNRRRWMKDLPDDKKITDFSLPGTHNSCARSGDPYQDWDLATQLEKGIRFLDIRGRHVGNKLKIHHDFTYQGIDIGKIIATCQTFLHKNPTEFIMISLKDEYIPESCTRDYEDTVNDVFHFYPHFIYKEDEIPTLDIARGKIVLVRRYPGHLGLDVKSFIIQDGPGFNKPRDDSDEHFNISFVSGYTWGTQDKNTQVRAVAAEMNAKVEDYFKHLSDFAWACIVLMDFPTEGAINQIIAQCQTRFNCYAPHHSPGFTCLIQNKQHEEYLYAADSAQYDHERRRVFTWRPGDKHEKCTWKLIPTSDKYLDDRLFYIYNIYQKEYLHAADAKFDDLRRLVFTWRSGCHENSSIWRLDKNLITGLYKLYNVHRGEYLYASDHAPYDQDRRRVFTSQTQYTMNEEKWVFEWGEGEPSFTSTWCTIL